MDDSSILRRRGLQVSVTSIFFFFSYCSQCRRSLKNDSLSNELKLTEYVTVTLEFEFSCFQLIYILLIRSRILYEVIKCILLVSALNPIGL